MTKINKSDIFDLLRSILISVLISVIGVIILAIIAKFADLSDGVITSRNAYRYEGGQILYSERSGYRRRFRAAHLSFIGNSGGEFYRVGYDLVRRAGVHSGRDNQRRHMRGGEKVVEKKRRVRSQEKIRLHFHAIYITI